MERLPVMKLSFLKSGIWSEPLLKIELFYRLAVGKKSHCDRLIQVFNAMKLLKLLFAGLALLLFSACNPKVTSNVLISEAALPYDQEVAVVGLNEPRPEGAKVLATVKIGDSGFTTNCSYGIVLEYAKIETRKLGGNVMNIIDHKAPSVFTSTCHRLVVEVLLTDGSTTSNVASP